MRLLACLLHGLRQVCDAACRFEKIFGAYRAKKSLAESAVKFIFEGARLKPAQTPGEMGMEDGDIIDAGTDHSADISSTWLHDGVDIVDVLPNAPRGLRDHICQPSSVFAVMEQIGGNVVDHHTASSA